MRSIALVAIAATLLLAPIASSQNVVIGNGVVNNTAFTWPTPYGNWYSGMRCQFIIPAVELAAASMSTTAISSIGFDVVTTGGAALQGYTIKLGHTAALSLSGGFDPASLTNVFGPTAYQHVPGWNDHVLQTVFSWNGTDSIVVDICFWNGANNYTVSAIINSSTLGYTASYTEYDDSTPPCGANALFTDFSFDRPNMRFALGGTIPAIYDTNSPEASLDINGVSAGSFAPTIVNLNSFTGCGAGSVPTPATGTVNIATSGDPSVVYEIVMDTSPLVPLGGGGLSFLGGILNLNAASAPSWTYLNGGTSLSFDPFPGFGFPGATGASLAVPISISTVLDISMQGAFVAPTFATGVELTLATELHVAVISALPSIPGPMADDTNLIIDVTSGDTCWAPGGVSFNGTVYSNICIAPNGRILFGALGDADYSPTVSEALLDAPGFGFWTDFNVTTGGNITVSSPAPGIIRADWNGVPYIGEPTGLCSFGLEIDDLSQIVRIDGLGGIIPNPLSGGFQYAEDAQFLGLSVGATGGATDPGITTFSAGGGGPAVPNLTDMLYDYYDYTTGVGGLLNSLTTPISSIDFNYIAGVGWLWTGN